MARHLITSAIPYINGIKHLGNLVGSQLPADLYARYLRGRGHEVLFLCATDEHGTPAELAAAKARFQASADVLDQAIIGESARWGDFKRGDPYDRENWLAAVSGKINSWIVTVIGRVKNDGLIPWMNHSVDCRKQALSSTGSNSDLFIWANIPLITVFNL